MWALGMLVGLLKWFESDHLQNGGRKPIR